MKIQTRNLVKSLLLVLIGMAIGALLTTQPRRMFDRVMRHVKPQSTIRNFDPVPLDGFRTWEEMNTFATNSSFGGGIVEELKAGSNTVWVMKRSGASGAFLGQLTIFRMNFDGTFKPFVLLPRTLNEDFKIVQNENGVLINGIDETTGKAVSILQIFRLP